MGLPSWIDQSEYPFESKWFKVGTKQMHYVDEGQGKPIVFLHGSPLWSFTYRHLIKNLRGQFRCIAPDFIGFGLSDKPTNWTYRPERQAEYLADFLDSLRLEEVMMVVHGTSGPAALSYAIQRPEKVSHLILMNTHLGALDDAPAVHKLDKMANGPLGRFLFLNMNWAVRSLKFAVQDKKYFTKDVHDHFAIPLNESSERIAPYGFARALLGSGGFYRSLWDRRQALATIPTMLLWGMKDPMFGEDALVRMQRVFPEAEVKKFATAGHYLTEEKGPGLTPIVEMFMTDSAYLPTATLM